MRRINQSFPLITLSLIVILCSLFYPSQSTSAQSQDEDPDFIVTLALMALADDRMDGVMDASALSDLRAVVDEYYQNKSLIHMDEDTSAELNHEKQVVLSALDNKIYFEKSYDYRVKLGLFTGAIDTFTAQDNDDPYKNFRTALLSSYTPDPEIMAMLQQRMSDGTQTSLQDNLNGNLAANVENGESLVDTAYDFTAGQSTDESAEEVAYGPLMFVNTGAKDVRLVVEYYEPPVHMSASAPSLDAIVPGDSSIVQDGFPAGSYVFCVDWETNMDTDGDGVKDYDKAVFHTWISNLHSVGDLEANAVHVGASFSPTPTGRCDGFKGEAPQTETLMTELFMTEDNPDGYAAEPTVESTSETTPEVDPTDEPESSTGADFWDQGDGESDDDGDTSGSNQGDTSTGPGTTAAELANQGEHAYEMVCENEGLSDTRSFTTTWAFTEDGVILGGDSFYAWIAANTYQNDYGTIITFTTSGYIADSFYSETSSDGQTTTSQTHCTATITQ
jgi:hypothetical protein